MGTALAAVGREAREEAVRRGEIWWADLPAPTGRRPVVLVSRDDAYALINSVTAVEVTTTVRGIRSEVHLGRDEGLPRPSVANADNVYGVRKDRIASRIGALRRDKMDALDAALCYALALPEPYSARDA